MAAASALPGNSRNFTWWQSNRMSQTGPVRPDRYKFPIPAGQKSRIKSLLFWIGVNSLRDCHTNFLFEERFPMQHRKTSA
jgi:hypothetical protein